MASLRYGSVTGRVTAVAVDPADPSGNTVYIGTTGGGVWKSTNAAWPAASVIFHPLTDTLPVFNANAGSTAAPSLAIGALSVANGVGGGVILAGTGDPNHAADSFYGSGLLRSTDGGLNWTLISYANAEPTYVYSFAGLAFAGFAWSTTSPATVVAAVADSARGSLVNATGGTGSVMGIYYSLDSGQSWRMATLMDGTQKVQGSGMNSGSNAVTSVVWNPVRQRFYAAVRYHGYYESSDGITWSRMAQQQQPGPGLTTAVCPAQAGMSGSTGCPIFRGALAVQPVTGDVFALSVDAANVDQGLWEDVCASNGSACTGADAFTTQLSATPMETGGVIPRGDYNLALAAVSTGSDTLLLAGTQDLYRCSLSSGCSLLNATNALGTAPAGVAPAQHAIAALTISGQPTVFLGNDGGLWRSTDGANNFDNLNGGLGSLAEVVSLAQNPTDADTLLAGLGAMGTAATSAASAGTPWPQLSAGEGGVVAIDLAQPSLWYVSTAPGVSITRCAKGSACTAADFAATPTIGASQVAQDASAADAPWMLDSAYSANAIVGTCRAWRGPADGTGWSADNAISAMMDESSTCVTGNSVIRSLAAGGAASSTATAAQNMGSEVLYAGMAGALDGGGVLGGHIFTTANAATSPGLPVWTDIAINTVTNEVMYHGVFNPGGFDVPSIAVDPHDPSGMTIYAAIMGFYSNGASVPKLYRSVNGGTSWTAVSSNMPFVPANSVVIDPNDANTVYVATDAGVYVTNNITNCADITSSCWNLYGVGLPNAPVMQLAIAAAMPAGSGQTGMLRAATYGRGIWQIPLMTSAVTQTAIETSTASLSFTNQQQVGTASGVETVTVTNSGNAPLMVSSVVITGDFTETNQCENAVIAAGASCTVQVRFLPAATGSRTGVLTIYGNVSGGQATVALTGTAIPGGNVVLSPVMASFPATTVNAASAPVDVTISNTGTGTATLQKPTVTGDFAITANTCGATLAAQTGCTVAIVFSPTASGSREGTLTVVSDAGTGTTALSGTGTLPATGSLSTLALAFAPQQMGTASQVQIVTLTNTGDVALTLIAAVTSGDFSVVSYCGSSLAAHASCSLLVSFRPQNVGPESGALIVSDEYGTQTVALTGTGAAPPGVSLAPSQGLTFAATGVGMASATQVVTLTNNGGLPLTINSLSTSGDFAITANGCGATLALASACIVQVEFTPAAAGTRTGSLTVIDDAPGSPHTLALSGAGVDFALVADGATTVTVSSGESAVFPLLFSSDTAVSGTATLTCTGAPANSVCTVTPSSVTLGYATTITATVQTGVSTASLKTSRSAWLVFVVPVVCLALRRRCRIPWYAALLVLVCLTGCSVQRLIPGDGGSSGTGLGVTTSPGSYGIVVTATSAGLSRSVNLTMVVQ
ncbi:MAG: choice-of-anchor D domain-containing protein [Acidobacteriaceae bacterium]|nr:choice-of-anchor D domain-containing protein [Acidobacteriaceae bacterium]